MVSPALRSEAIVLGRIDTGDADRVVTLLSKDLGKISAFAASARKSRRRFAGALEPFTLLSVQLRKRRSELWFLDSCSILESHAGLRTDLGRIAYAAHAAELCRELIRDEQPHEDLFGALLRYLAHLATTSARPDDLLAFELAVLDSVGFSPRVSRCAICSDTVLGVRLFDPSHGGVLCAGCEGAAYPGAVRMDEAVRSVLDALRRNGPCGGAVESDAPTRARARELVRRFTHHTLGHNPRSLAVLSQLGIEG